MSRIKKKVDFLGYAFYTHSTSFKVNGIGYIRPDENINTVGRIVKEKSGTYFSKGMAFVIDYDGIARKFYNVSSREYKELEDDSVRSFIPLLTRVGVVNSIIDLGEVEKKLKTRINNSKKTIRESLNLNPPGELKNDDNIDQFFYNIDTWIHSIVADWKKDRKELEEIQAQLYMPLYSYDKRTLRYRLMAGKVGDENYLD